MLTGRVVGSVGRFVAHAGRPMSFTNARVTFWPDVQSFPTDDPTLLVPDTVVCSLDEQGRIVDPTDGVSLGVTLAASDSVEGGFTYTVRISGPTFTQGTFHIAVPAGVDTDIATAVHVPPDAGRVVDRLTGLVGTVQGWVDDPGSLPDVGPAVEAATGAAASAQASADGASESARSAAGDRERAESAAETAQEAAANASQAGITAWPDPTNPDLLVLEFPAFLSIDDGRAVVIPTVTGA